MQINYHFVVTKIKKLQNFKKKKKNFFLYRPVLPEIGRYGWYGRYLNWYETLIFRYRYSIDYID